MLFLSKVNKSTIGVVSERKTDMPEFSGISVFCRNNFSGSDTIRQNVRSLCASISCKVNDSHQWDRQWKGVCI